MKATLVLLILISVIFLHAVTVAEIIDRVDENMVYRDMKFTASMTITENNEQRSMTMNIFLKDEDNVLIEVLTSTTGHTNRFMKKKDQMWLYIPSAGHSIRIKGHMLKEGFMGSDFSYEDMSENRSTDDLYDMELISEDTLYIIKLTAKSEDAPYKMKMEYISKDSYLPVKEEIYSSTGRLLKEFYIMDYEYTDNRYIPTKMVMYDLLQQGSSTEIKYDEIDVNANLQEHYFSKAYLER